MSRTTLTLLFTSFTLFTICECQTEESTKQKKYTQAVEIATSTLHTFYELFQDCINHSMGQKFLMDDLPRVVNWPSKTTVGLAPKFTFNRKFFANMIKTTECHEMMAYDEKLLRNQWVKKMKYCDKSVMDQDILKDFYDREIDINKV